MPRPVYALLLAIVTLTLSAPLAATAQTNEPPTTPSQPPSALHDHATRGDLFYYQGDDYRAVTEYKLHLQSIADPDERDTTRLRVAWIYSRAKKYTAAADMLKRVVFERGRDDRMALWASLYYADVARMAERDQIAADAYTHLITRCTTTSLQKRQPECEELVTIAYLGMALQAARAHDFTRARAHLDAIPAGSYAADDARKVSAYVGALDIPHKSPALAGVLSIVPGLGHFYLEEYSTGALAMVWNGAFIYALVDAIRDRNYGYAVLIGLLETIWYSGTIFGAVSGAQRFNRDARSIVSDGLTRDLERMRRPIPWPQRFPRQEPLLKLQLELSF